jgi:hypothetical protein
MAIIQHLAAVITIELREGGNIVSAMLTDRKSLPRRPEDAEVTNVAGRKRGQRKQRS